MVQEDLSTLSPITMADPPRPEQVVANLSAKTLEALLGAAGIPLPAKKTKQSLMEAALPLLRERGTAVPNMQRRGGKAAKDPVAAAMDVNADASSVSEAAPRRRSASASAEGGQRVR